MRGLTFANSERAKNERKKKEITKRFVHNNLFIVASLMISLINWFVKKKNVLLLRYFIFFFADFSFFFRIFIRFHYYPIERIYIYSNWIVNRDYRDAKRRKEEKKIKKKEKGNEGSRMPFPGQRIRLTLT